MSYPEIDNDLDLDAALRGAEITNVILRSISRAVLAVAHAAALDPSLQPALEDFSNGLHDLMSDLTVTLEARDAAITAYENADVEWEPGAMRGTQAGRTL